MIRSENYNFAIDRRIKRKNDRKTFSSKRYVHCWSFTINFSFIRRSIEKLLISFLKSLKTPPLFILRSYTVLLRHYRLHVREVNDRSVTMHVQIQISRTLKQNQSALIFEKNNNSFEAFVDMAETKAFWKKQLYKA